MAFTWAKKQEMVSDLHDTLKNSGLVVALHYKGLSVKQVQDLQGKMRAQNANFKATKNTLAKIALKGTPYEHLNDFFTGPTAIAASQDPVSAAKVAHEFAKKNEKLVILGGAMGEHVLDAKSIEAVANLPSLEELRSKIVGVLQAPAGKLARLMQTPAQNLVGVTKAYGETG